MPNKTDLPEALAALMPQLAGVAFSLTGNRDQAQDLCQDVLLKLWARRQQGHQIDNLRAYAMAALRNQYRQWLRDQTHETELNETDEPTTPDVFGAMLVQDLQAAIAALPDTQARLMRLVASGETSPRALARITGWPLGTVMSRLARARVRLRVKIGIGAKAPMAELL